MRAYAGPLKSWKKKQKSYSHDDDDDDDYNESKMLNVWRNQNEQINSEGKKSSNMNAEKNMMSYITSPALPSKICGCYNAFPLYKKTTTTKKKLCWARTKQQRLHALRLITWKYQSLHFAFAFSFRTRFILIIYELLKFQCCRFIYIVTRYCEFVLCFQWAHPSQNNNNDDDSNNSGVLKRACKPKKASVCT